MPVTVNIGELIVVLCDISHIDHNTIETLIDCVTPHWIGGGKQEYSTIRGGGTLTLQLGISKDGELWKKYSQKPNY